MSIRKKVKLTKDFSKHEFDSKDGADMPPSVFFQINKLARNLQVLRDHFNARIVINSGFRSYQHNKAVGGASNSQHLYGKAADFVVDGQTPEEVYEAIEMLQAQGKMLQGGMRVYPTFLHYDTRGKRVRW